MFQNQPNSKILYLKQSLALKCFFKNFIIPLEIHLYLRQLPTKRYGNLYLNKITIKEDMKSHRQKIATKIGENKSTFQTAIFGAKFTFWPIKLNICMQESKFTSHKQYLIGLLFSIKVKKEDSYRPKCTSSFLICPNLNDSQTVKNSSRKNFFFQCVCYRCNLLQ